MEVTRRGGHPKVVPPNQDEHMDIAELVNVLCKKKATTNGSLNNHNYAKLGVTSMDLVHNEIRTFASKLDSDTEDSGEVVKRSSAPTVNGKKVQKLDVHGDIARYANRLNALSGNHSTALQPPVDEYANESVEMLSSLLNSPAGMSIDDPFSSTFDEILDLEELSMLSSPASLKGASSMDLLLALDDNLELDTVNSPGASEDQKSISVNNTVNDVLINVTELKASEPSNGCDQAIVDHADDHPPKSIHVKEGSIICTSYPAASKQKTLDKDQIFAKNENQHSFAAASTDSSTTELNSEKKRGLLEDCGDVPLSYQDNLSVENVFHCDEVKATQVNTYSQNPNTTDIKATSEVRILGNVPEVPNDTSPCVEVAVKDEKNKQTHVCEVSEGHFSSSQNLVHETTQQKSCISVQLIKGSPDIAPPKREASKVLTTKLTPSKPSTSNVSNNTSNVQFSVLPPESISSPLELEKTNASTEKNLNYLVKKSILHQSGSKSVEQKRVLFEAQAVGGSKQSKDNSDLHNTQEKIKPSEIKIVEKACKNYSGDRQQGLGKEVLSNSQQESRSEKIDSAESHIKHSAAKQTISAACSSDQRHSSNFSSLRLKQTFLSIPPPIPPLPEGYDKQEFSIHVPLVEKALHTPKPFSLSPDQSQFRPVRFSRKHSTEKVPEKPQATSNADGQNSGNLHSKLAHKGLKEKNQTVQDGLAKVELVSEPVIEPLVPATLQNPKRDEMKITNETQLAELADFLRNINIGTKANGSCDQNERSYMDDDMDDYLDELESLERSDLFSHSGKSKGKMNSQKIPVQHENINKVEKPVFKEQPILLESKLNLQESRHTNSITSLVDKPTDDDFVCPPLPPPPTEEDLLEATSTGTRSSSASEISTSTSGPSSIISPTFKASSKFSVWTSSHGVKVNGTEQDFVEKANKNTTGPVGFRSVSRPVSKKQEQASEPAKSTVRTSYTLPDGQHLPAPSETVKVTPKDELPEGAVYETHTIEGDLLHTDTYYPAPGGTKVLERTKKTTIIKAEHHHGMGPTDDQGVPVALRSTVENQKAWYKNMFKQIHKFEDEEGNDPNRTGTDDFVEKEPEPVVSQKPYYKPKRLGRITDYTPSEPYVVENKPQKSNADCSIRRKNKMPLLNGSSKPSSSKPAKTRQSSSLEDFVQKEWVGYFDDVNKPKSPKHVWEKEARELQKDRIPPASTSYNPPHRKELPKPERVKPTEEPIHGTDYSAKQDYTMADYVVTEPKQPTNTHHFHNKPASPKGPEVRIPARAKFDFKAKSDKQLTILKDQTVIITREVNKDWYEGESADGKRNGIFPVAYVELLTKTPAKPARRGLAKAKFDFTANSPKQLTIKKGDSVELVEKVDKNWYKAAMGSKSGIIPANYIEVTREPEEVKKKTGSPKSPAQSNTNGKKSTTVISHQQSASSSSSNSEPDDKDKMSRASYLAHAVVNSGANLSHSKPRRGEFDIPELDDAAMGISPRNDSGDVQHSPQGSYETSSSTMSSSLHSDFDKSLHVSPAEASSNKGKSEEFIMRTEEQNNGIDQHDDGMPVMHKHVALYAYSPQNEDELELLGGDIVQVVEMCDDGWFVGTCERTGAFGTFPGNYVIAVD